MKTTNKTILLVIAVFLIGLKSYSQTTLEILKPFVIFGIDPKMATKGAGHDWGDSPSFDYEIGFGIYTFNDNLRISHLYKQHDRIGFEKFTLLKVDRRVKLFSNFEGYAGLETSLIKRESFTYHYSKPHDYRKYNTEWFKMGANIELNYKPKWSNVSLYLKGSMYQSEEALKQYKRFRKDFTIGFIFHSYR